MKKIKILNITQSFGGVETYLKLVVQHINRDKFEIVIATPQGETLQSFCRQNGVTHHVINLSRSFNPIKDISSFFKIISLIRKEKPDVVHLHSGKAGFLGRIVTKMMGRKSVFSPHGGSYLSFTGVKRIMFFLLEVIGRKCSYKALAISQSEALRMIYEIGFKKENVFVIPNSLPFPGFPQDIPDNLGRLQGEFKVGTIGRLTQQKDPILFADIANQVIKQNAGAHFYFLGAGYHDHLRKEVDERVKEHGIENNFHLIDMGDRNKAFNFLRQLNVFLLPSIYEGLPYSLLEAMQEKVPCVVSKCDGNNDVINNNENGFSCMLLPEYTEIINRLMKDPHLAKQIGEAGYKHVFEKLNMTTNIQLLENMYTSII